MLQICSKAIHAEFCTLTLIISSTLQYSKDIEIKYKGKFLHYYNSSSTICQNAL